MTSTHIEQSPQLLPNILEQRARTEPERVWAKFPVSPTTYAEGFRSATYAQIRNAVDRVSWLLHESIGPSTTFETLAYMGPTDLRYHIMLLAAIKTGYKVFFPSPRNSLVAQMSLLSQLECKVLVTTDPEPPFVAPIRQKGELKIIHIPSLDDLLRFEGAPYAYDKRFEEARNDPAFVLHTSGSTGIPKPMIYTHEYIWRLPRAVSFPAEPPMTRIDDLFMKGTFFSVLPGFHIAGIGWGLILPMFSNSIPVLPLPGRPPSTDGFLEAIAHGSFDWAFLLPVIIDELSTDPTSLALVASKLQYLFYTGGAIPQEAGEKVSAQIPVFSGLGSSECAAFPQLRIPDPSFTETWRYLFINPIARPEFRHRMDDLYEFVIVRSSETPEAQPVFALFPELDEYETRDLFSPHPTIPGLWRHRGRRDDIVVFLNGEKTNPVSFEQTVAGHPDVSAALVGGSQRFEACLLIEPAGSELLSESEREGLVDRVWATVEEANRACPAHARVSRDKILIVDPSRPMLRAGKGTVQRAGTFQLYSAEIEALYSGSGPVSAGEEQLEVPSNREAGEERLRTLISGITGWSEFDNDTDFFALGMDSLHVLQLSGAIRSNFGLSSFAPSAIYRGPSVALLLDQLYPNDIDKVESRTERMARTLQHYQRQIDALNPSQSPSQTHSPASQVVLLTGSTGAIGSYILHELLRNPAIAHVYCLNRSPNSQVKQEAMSRRQRLPTKYPLDRVTFLTGNPAEPSLALDEQIYQRILTSTTQIIHNAWPVDFNQTLSSFRPSLDGLLGLISLSQASKHRASLLFLSSISSVSEYHHTANAELLVPEQAIADLHTPAPMGYGESKYLSERILDYAATQLHLPCAVARVGQVCGTAKDPHGWKRSEWLPSLILSSAYMRKLPESLGSMNGEAGGFMDVIDWVPVDKLGRILVELSSAVGVGAAFPVAKGVQVYHCVNPRPIAWKELIPTITSVLEQDGKEGVETVGFVEWLVRLRASAVITGSSDLSLSEVAQQNPGVKLVEFYEQLIAEGEQNPTRLSLQKSVQASRTLRDLQPVQKEWVQGWIAEWLET